MLIAREVKTDPKMRRSRMDARLMAEDLLQQLQSGADFKRLSLKRSDDNSATRGGELGFSSAV